MPDLEVLLTQVNDGLVTGKSLATLDKPNVSLLGFDPFIEKGAIEYIKSKYHYILKKIEIPSEILRDQRKYNRFLVDIALSNDNDIRVLDRGEIHFKINATQVATQDLTRHKSMRFKQTGQSKQIDLNINIPKEEAKKLSTQMRYFLPPEWGEKAPHLAAEVNSVATYMANLIKRAIDMGVPTSQAKYPLLNASTTDLEISGTLRSFYNMVGLRTCGCAQPENQYSNGQMARILKMAMPDLTQKLGPRCVFEGRCKEGDSCCGEMPLQKKRFFGDTSSLLISWLEEYEQRMETAQIREYNNSAFIENYKIAFEEYSKLNSENLLPAIFKPELSFAGSTPDIEKLNAKRAKMTYKRLDKKQRAQDIELSDKLSDKILKTVEKREHAGAYQQGSLTYDFKISRILWHKLVRHWSLDPIASSQHHIEHSNFSYMIPPAWIEVGLDTEFHVLMRYLNNLYERAMSAGISKGNARYVLPINAMIDATMTGTPRSWYSPIRQRSCPTNSWEEREFFPALALDLKKRAPSLFYYAGPPCLTSDCSKPYDLTKEEMQDCKNNAKKFFLGEEK